MCGWVVSRDYYVIIGGKWWVGGVDTGWDNGERKEEEERLYFHYLHTRLPLLRCFVSLFLRFVVVLFPFFALSSSSLSIWWLVVASLVDSSSCFAHFHSCCSRVASLHCMPWYRMSTVLFVQVESSIWS